MRLSKLLLIISLILISWHVWRHHFKASKSDVEVSEAGFIKVAWIEEAETNEVVIIGPT